MVKYTNILINIIVIIEYFLNFLTIIVLKNNFSSYSSCKRRFKNLVTLYLIIFDLMIA